MIDAAQPKSPEAAKAWLGRVQEIVSKWRAENEPHRNSDAMPIRPERICKEISEMLPPDGVVVSDTGHAGIWTGTMIDFKYPTQRYFPCAGSLGWGFPAALGVKCALPDKPVLCFTGDGGFYYHIAELETARRYNINVVVVVNNNSGLNQEITLNKAQLRRPAARQLDRFMDIYRQQFCQDCRGIRLRRYPGRKAWRDQGGAQAGVCDEQTRGGRCGERCERARQEGAHLIAGEVSVWIGFNTVLCRVTRPNGAMRPKKAAAFPPRFRHRNGAGAKDARAFGKGSGGTGVFSGDDNSEKRG